jgi:hypothetical protein
MTSQNSVFGAAAGRPLDRGTGTDGRGVPVPVTTVQLGGSLAGNDSLPVSSTTSSNERDAVGVSRTPSAEGAESFTRSIGSGRSWLSDRTHKVILLFMGQSPMDAPALANSPLKMAYFTAT